MRKPVEDVDTYIAAAPKEARSKLSELRSIIKATVPEADEVISYKMPYYNYHGPLVGFAAFKNHIGLFGELSAEDKRMFKDYPTSKGTIRFPFDRPLPDASIRRMIQERKKRNESRIK